MTVSMLAFIIFKLVSTILTNPFFYYKYYNIDIYNTLCPVSKNEHCYANTTIMILLEDLRIKVLQN